MSEVTGRNTGSIGYGYVLGRRATWYERVRKARKSYSCEGCSVDSDTAEPGVQVSPMTGSILFEGWADDCAGTIQPGDLYVASEYTGEHAQDCGGAYRCTFRTCIACAFRYEVIATPVDGASK